MDNKFKEFIEGLDNSIVSLYSFLGLYPILHRHAIKIIEYKILEMYPDVKELKGPGILPFGYHYGATVIKMFNGRWDSEYAEKSDSIYDITVVFENMDGNKSIVFPFRTIINFIKDPKQSLCTKLDLLEFTYVHSTDEIRQLQTDSEGWVHRKNGLAFRITEKNDGL